MFYSQKTAATAKHINMVSLIIINTKRFKLIISCSNFYILSNITTSGYTFSVIRGMGRLSKSLRNCSTNITMRKENIIIPNGISSNSLDSMKCMLNPITKLAIWTNNIVNIIHVLGFFLSAKKKTIKSKLSQLPHVAVRW